MRSYQTQGAPRGLCIDAGATCIAARDSPQSRSFIHTVRACCSVCTVTWGLLSRSHLCSREDPSTTSTDLPSESELESIPSWSSSASPREEDGLGPTRFAVRGIVSESACGTVYLVRDTVQERDAAMTVAPVSRSLLAEVKLLRRLSRTPHPFLLAPYSGATRHWWKSPSGDLHILTVSHCTRALLSLSHVGAGTLWRRDTRGISGPTQPQRSVAGSGRTGTPLIMASCSVYSTEPS